MDSTQSIADLIILAFLAVATLTTFALRSCIIPSFSHPILMLRCLPPSRPELAYRSSVCNQVVPSTSRSPAYHLSSRRHDKTCPDPDRVEASDANAHLRERHLEPLELNGQADSDVRNEEE